jgi:hypothetical protein
MRTNPPELKDKPLFISYSTAVLYMVATGDIQPRLVPNFQTHNSIQEKILAEHIELTQ